jgi:hypothetical protein
MRAPLSWASTNSARRPQTNAHLTLLPFELILGRTSLERGATSSCSGAARSQRGVWSQTNALCQLQTLPVSLDHFVSEREYIRRDFQTEQLGAIEINDQRIFGRLLDR